MTTATAILYFARTPVNDLKVGRFENERIHTHLISGLNRKTKQAIRASKIPAILCDERLQQGDSFAERLTHAIQAVFDKGYDNVIAVGNDCPELSGIHLLRAKNVLESGANVLGPSIDGGDYLIGIRKSSFQVHAFCNAFTQKDEVHKTLMSVLSDLYSKPTELEILNDIDDTGSLHLWLKGRKYSSKLRDFIVFLVDLITAKIYGIFLPLLPVVRLAPYHKPRRGPPERHI